MRETQSGASESVLEQVQWSQENRPDAQQNLLSWRLIFLSELENKHQTENIPSDPAENSIIQRGL